MKREIARAFIRLGVGLFFTALIPVIAGAGEPVPGSWLESLYQSCRVSREATLHEAYRMHTTSEVFDKSGEKVEVKIDTMYSYFAWNSEGKLEGWNTDSTGRKLKAIKIDKDTGISDPDLNRPGRIFEPLLPENRDKYSFTLMPSPATGQICIAYEPHKKSKERLAGTMVVDTTSWALISLSGAPSKPAFGFSMTSVYQCDAQGIFRVQRREETFIMSVPLVMKRKMHFIYDYFDYSSTHGTTAQ